MQINHIPKVNARYWTAITMASIFGTNMGDLYADDAQLGIWLGTSILAAIAAVVFMVERQDKAPRELYYWLAIIIIRTGATNIADYVKHQIPWLAFGIILAVLMAGFAWLSARGDVQQERASEARGMPSTGLAYWAAMLTAGVLGTFYGDVASKFIGQGAASLTLGAALLGALFVWKTDSGNRFWLYWGSLAIARSFGTAAGDWFAESPIVNIGLPLSTMITGTVFVLILVLWRRGGGAAVPIQATGN